MDKEHEDMMREAFHGDVITDETIELIEKLIPQKCLECEDPCARYNWIGKAPPPCPHGMRE